MVLRNVSLVCAVADNCVVGMEGLAPPLLRHKTTVLCRKQKLRTQIYDLLLDLDTCLTPEAQN